MLFQVDGKKIAAEAAPTGLFIRSAARFVAADAASSQRSGFSGAR
jgi:hypothetical protein